MRAAASARTRRCEATRLLDRPLIVKRASDLLSKWVGETEAQIAAAFAEARRREGVLLFDEVDSLLFDRATARTSWEVGQVNELLTWLDRYRSLLPRRIRRATSMRSDSPQVEQSVPEAARSVSCVLAPKRLKDVIATH